MPIPTITVLLDLDSESGTFGKYVLTDITDWAGLGITAANIIGIFSVTDALGVYRVGNFDTPDTNGDDPNWVYDDLDIRKINALPGYLTGAITITYQAKDTGTGLIYTTTTEYNWCPPDTVIDPLDGHILPACETHTIDCFNNRLQITDTTKYGVYTTLDREMELDPPAFEGLSPVTTTSNILTYIFTWVNVAYTLFIDSLVSYVSGNVTVNIRMNLTNTITVKCLQSIPKLYSCFVKFSQAFRTDACKYGGEFNIPSNFFSDYINVIARFEELDKMQKIGNFTGAEALFDEIMSIMNRYVACDCCCDTDVPTFVVPPTTPGTEYNFGYEYPVVVSQTGTNLLFSLDPAFIALVNSLYNTTLVSTDGSVNVGSGPNYDLSIVNSFAFKVEVVYEAGTDMSVTVENKTASGNRYNAEFPIAEADAQIIGFPHGTIDALKAERAVLYIKNFLTNGIEDLIPDKLDVDILFLKNSAALDNDYDFSQPKKYLAEIRNVTNVGFYIQLFDTAGLAVTMEEILAQVQKIVFTIKINQ